MVLWHVYWERFWNVLVVPWWWLFQQILHLFRPVEKTGGIGKKQGNDKTLKNRKLKAWYRQTIMVINPGAFKQKLKEIGHH